MDAEDPDPLLHSELASQIEREYGIVTRGGRRADDDPTPVFERELHVSSSTFVFGEDPRPRARN
jgi:hypothetical protein